MSQTKPPMGQKGNDMTVPGKVKDTFAATTAMMLASLNIPQPQLDAAESAFWGEIEGHGVRSITNQEPLDRSISRKQASELLGKSLKTISLMIMNGTLHGIYGGRSRKRITGISEASVRALMAGK